MDAIEVFKDDMVVGVGEILVSEDANELAFGGVGDRAEDFGEDVAGVADALDVVVAKVSETA